jgi:hypothetical protein
MVRGASAIARSWGLAPSLFDRATSGFSPGCLNDLVASDGKPPLWLADLFPPYKIRFSAKHAHDRLGWAPRISLKTAQDRTAEWARQNGYYVTGRA